MNSYSVEKPYSTERLFYCHDPYTGFVQAWTRSEEEITTQILKTQNSDWCGIHKRFQRRKLFVETEYN